MKLLVPILILLAPWACAQEIEDPVVPIVPVETVPPSPFYAELLVGRVDAFLPVGIPWMAMGAPAPKELYASAREQSAKEQWASSLWSPKYPARLLVSDWRFVPNEGPVAFQKAIPAPKELYASARELPGGPYLRASGFAVDPEAWSKYASLLSYQPSKIKGTESWVEIDEAKLKALINRVGYSPEAMAFAENILQRKTKLEKLNTLGSGRFK